MRWSASCCRCVEVLPAAASQAATTFAVRTLSAPCWLSPTSSLWSHSPILSGELSIKAKVSQFALLGRRGAHFFLLKNGAEGGLQQADRGMLLFGGHDGNGHDEEKADDNAGRLAKF